MMPNLTSLIKTKIQSHGPIRLDEYMSIALQHPELGYYQTKQAIGQRGDFITSPEISQTFGEMIAFFLMNYVQNNFPDYQQISLCELGPGKGTLLRDILRTVARYSAFEKRISHIYLLETSPVFQKSIAEKLESFEIPYSFHSEISFATQEPILFYANEFLDALPIRQFYIDASLQKAQEIFVGIDSHSQELSLLRSDCASLPYVPHPEHSGIYEYCPVMETYLNPLFDHIKKVGGAFLTFDYGYEHAPLSSTFQALHQHQQVNPLTLVGQADLTAHVNFSHIKKLAQDQGLYYHGTQDQGIFLEELGIWTRTHQLMQDKSQKMQDEIKQSTQRLVASDQMGTLFKTCFVTQT